MRVDLHCHLLPGIDDGAKTLEQALEMARIAVADGITTTVVTPHHLNGVYRNRAAEIRLAVDRMRAELRRANIQLELLPGSEIHLTPETPGALAEGTALTVADRRKAALVELPVHTVPIGVEHLLEEIIAAGLTPIIAHPERNSELRRSTERLADWVAMGCLAQVTVQSCTGRFGEPVRQAAKRMVAAGLIHVAASDAHRDQRRVPQLSTAHGPISDWTNREVATLLLDTFPADLAAGRKPDPELLHRALAAIRRPRSIGQKLIGWMGKR